jgi:hypothetical protein
VCSVSFIVCVVLCAVLCLNLVCYFFVMFYLCVVSYCSTTVPGKIPLAVKINNNNMYEACCDLNFQIHLYQ